MKNTTIVVLIGAVIALIVLLGRSCNKYEEAEQFNAALRDSLTRTIDKHGVETATISNLEATNDKLLLKIQTSDTTVKWLQQVVRDFNGKLQAAIVASNSTRSQGSTTTVVTRDSTNSPVYTSSWITQWDEGYIQATKDTIFRRIQIKNEYEFSIGRKTNGWFKPRESIVSVRNLNPNTVTRELRSFAVKQDQKKIGLGMHFGYGLTKDMELSPYVGVGFDFRLISIK